MVLQGEYEKLKGIRYEFDRFQQPVGEGGMGVIFKGVMIDERTDVVLREVAIKEVKADGNSEHVEDMLAKARRESGIRLRNDNLIEMLGFIEVEELKLNCSKIRYYVISEFLEGVTLVDVLEGRFADNLGNQIEYARQLSEKLKTNREETAEYIIRNILYGITALHDNGYIHRDLDPSNIMVTKDCKIKIIDFGIAKRLTDLTTADGRKSDGRFVGKVDYAAPELINCEVRNQNFTTDIYAIGVLFYLLLTNSLPFSGNRFDVMNAQLRKKVDVRGIESPKYRDIVRKAMAKKQEDRYATSSEMRVALDSACQTEVMDRRRPSRFWGALGAVAALALVVYVVVRLLPDPLPPLPPEPEPDPSPVTILVDPKAYLNKDRAALWKELKASPDNSAVLYALARSYEGSRADEHAMTYWDEELVPQGYAERNITLASKRTFASERFVFLLTTKARDCFKEGRFVEGFDKELEAYMDTFLTKYSFYTYKPI